jgi:hypothetical protein
VREDAQKIAWLTPFFAGKWLDKLGRDVVMDVIERKFEESRPVKGHPAQLRLAKGRRHRPPRRVPVWWVSRTPLRGVPSRHPRWPDAATRWHSPSVRAARARVA